jgi:hypothetical protein
MVTIVNIHGIRFYIAKLGINPSTKTRNGKTYTYYTKRVILPGDFPGDKVYILTEEDFKKLEKILKACTITSETS